MSAAPRWARVADGIYRDRTGTLYERPHVDGRRTFRSLKTAVLDEAQAILRARRTDQVRAEVNLAPDPYKTSQVLTVGAALRRYATDGYPDKQLCPRAGRTLQIEHANVEKLLEFWDPVPLPEVRPGLMDRYFQWRAKGCKAGCTGRRATDQELNTLSSAFQWCCRQELITANPIMFRRPKYDGKKFVRHCREFCPANADVLHSFAKFCFLVAGRRSEVLGFQMLVQAMTGLRLSEVLTLRTDAKEGEPGYISPDWSVLHVGRAKGQVHVNPYVMIHPALKECLVELFDWKRDKHPDSPSFFPTCHASKTGVVTKDALVHALSDASRVLGVEIHSHGLRAFYVKVRRSHGIPDQQIAAELGHETAGITLKHIYGSVPENWLTNGPKLSWLPSQDEPAWHYCGKAPKQPGTRQSKAPRLVVMPSPVAGAQAQPAALPGRRKVGTQRPAQRTASEGKSQAQAGATCNAA